MLGPSALTAGALDSGALISGALTSGALATGGGDSSSSAGGQRSRSTALKIWAESIVGPGLGGRGRLTSIKWNNTGNSRLDVPVGVRRGRSSETAYMRESFPCVGSVLAWRRALVAADN